MDEFDVTGVIVAVSYMGLMLITFIWHHPFLVHFELISFLTAGIVSLPLMWVMGLFLGGNIKNKVRERNIDNLSAIVFVLSDLIPALIITLKFDNSVIDPVSPVLMTVLAGFFGSFALTMDIMFISLVIHNLIFHHGE